MLLGMSLEQNVKLCDEVTKHLFIGYQIAKLGHFGEALGDQNVNHKEGFEVLLRVFTL